MLRHLLVFAFSFLLFNSAPAQATESQFANNTLKITNPYHEKWLSMYGSLDACCGCDCQCGDCPEPCSDCPIGILTPASIDVSQINNPYHLNWISMYGSLKACCGCDCQCGDCPEPCSDCPIGK